MDAEEGKSRIDPLAVDRHTLIDPSRIPKDTVLTYYFRIVLYFINSDVQFYVCEHESLDVRLLSGNSSST